MSKEWKLKFLCLLAGIVVSACGGAGKKSSGGGGASYASSVTGTIQSSTGDTAQFDGWILALVDASTGECRLAQIAGDGTYSFSRVDTNATYTIVMLNTDFRISSLLSMVAADVSSKVYQYFRVADDATIPRLIHKGPNMEFSNPDAVTIITHTADDTDADGIPDGMETVSSSLRPQSDEAQGNESDSEVQPSMAEFEPIALVRRETDTISDSDFTIAEDTDADGQANTEDADIDSDGMPNWFDTDDDANETLDIFDLDANADLTLDTAQEIGDHYFGDEIEYIAVQYFVEPNDVIKLRFAIKLTDAAGSPSSVLVQGSSDLFDEALIVAKNDSGVEEASDIWDRTLNDDGSSYDDASSDLIYGRKVKLKAGKEPEANQMVFVSVNFGSGDSAYSRDFPFVFPSLTTGSVSFSYSSSSQVVTRSGSPFGSITSYNWSISVFDSEGNLAHQSAAIEGATSTYTIPSTDIESGESYTARVYAQSLEKVSGYPVYVIQSSENDL